MAVEYEVQWRRGNQGWNVNNRQAETICHDVHDYQPNAGHLPGAGAGRTGWRAGAVVDPPERNS